MVTVEEINTLLVVQARTSSRRLPEKVLKIVNGKAILEWQLLRVMETTNIDQIVMATSEQRTDDPIQEIAERCGIPTVRGSLDDVLSRFCACIDCFKPRIVVRITGDCPMYMPRLCEQMLEAYWSEPVDYLSNTIPPTYPDGCDIEIFSTEAIRSLSSLELTPMEKEHVTLGIYSRNKEFNCKNFQNISDESQHRWTLDTAEDLEFVRAVYKEFSGREIVFTYNELMSFLKRGSGLARYDDGTMRNQAMRHVE